MATDNKELITIAFAHINSYKRARVMADKARKDGKRDEADIWELKKFREIDGLELSLRAIQKGVRSLEEDSESD